MATSAKATSDDMKKDKYILNLEDIPDGGSAIVQPNPYLNLAVFRHGEKTYVIQDRCPHGPASLARGKIDGYFISCPLHGLTFDVRTGEGPANWCVEAFPVRRRGDTISIELKKLRRRH